MQHANLPATDIWCRHGYRIRVADRRGRVERPALVSRLQRLDQRGLEHFEHAGLCLRVAHGAADAVAYGAEYLRGNDVRTMLSDLVEVIRRNPGPSLLGAAVLGFMLGRALSRD